MTQSDNSGVHAWSGASLRELVPPVDAEVTTGPTEQRSDPPAAAQIEPVEATAGEVVSADPEPTGVGAAEAGTEVAETAPSGQGASSPDGSPPASSIDTRSLDELERDLAALADRLRAPTPPTAESPDDPPVASPVVEVADDAPVAEAETSPPVDDESPVEEPDLSPTERRSIAAAAALLDARRAEAATSAAAESSVAAGDPADAETIEFESADPVAETIDPAALDLRDRERPGDEDEAAAADDEIDLRGPDEPAAAPSAGGALSGEGTLDEDAMAFVRDLASRADAGSPAGSAAVAGDVFDLGAIPSARADAPSSPQATPPTPAVDPASGEVFDLRSGAEPARPATTPGPPLQSSSVDWEAIVSESDSPTPVESAVDESVVESAVDESASVVDEAPVDELASVVDEAPAGEAPGARAATDEAPTVTTEALPTSPPAPEPESVEVTTVDWDAVVGDAAGEGAEAPAARTDDVAPPAIASSPAHPPRIQPPDDAAPDSPTEPADRSVDPPFESTISVRSRSTLARAALLTSLCADGLRDDDVAVLDGPAATALDELIAGFDDDVAPTLRAKTLRTDVVGESVPLAMGLSSLPVASAPARRIFAVVDRVELEHGSSWAALDALGESSPTPPVLVVTVDPSEMRPDERPDRLVQRWARRLLDLGWRAVDLRYGRDHRHQLEQNDAGTEMTVLLDAEGLGERIAAGSIDVGGNDLDDLRWFWDVVHRSRRPTVAFVYVSPPPSMPSESASSIAALADRLQREAPSAPRVPMLGLVRFDPEVHPASDTQAAVIDALTGLVHDDAAFRAATIVVSIGRSPLELPEGAVVVEVGEEAAAVSLARAASALGRLPIVIGPDERMAGAALAMAPTTDSDAGDAVLIGLHAGIDGGSELAAVRSRSVPAIAAATPRLEIVEPFATDWVDAQFRDALHRVDVGEGSTYFRVSCRPLPPSNVEDARLGPALRRGGALLHRSMDDPAVVLVGVGHLVPTALDAAMKLESEGVGVDVVGIAIAERLRNDEAEGSAVSSGLEQLIEAQRGHRLVVVLHDALGGLEWIGGATGLRAVSITPTGTEAPSADEIVETTKTALTR
ncbi:MAG: hypothetical protein AAFZ07_23690 [Actinomycetota bacterium]